jgi:hypothetical protein
MIETTQFDEETVVRQYNYADSEVVAADFGPVEDASVDVLDETVIAVVDGEQYELAVEDDARASVNNGVLTVEVDR